MAGCVVVFLLLISPWLARNYFLSGTLFGTAGFAISEETSAFPGARLVRSLPQNFAAELNRLGLEAYGRKLILGLARLIQDDLPKMGGSWLSAFFLPGLLIPFRNPSSTACAGFLWLPSQFSFSLRRWGRPALRIPRLRSTEKTF